jgi:hypothetical protein
MPESIPGISSTVRWSESPPSDNRALIQEPNLVGLRPSSIKDPEGRLGSRFDVSGLATLPRFACLADEQAESAIIHLQRLSVN